MIDFLLKSSISLLVLLIFYHLILEREKMHRFNRFYLLFGIVFSFALPFITIEIIGETKAPIQHPFIYLAQENLTVSEIKETIDYKSIILWSIYGFVTLLLLFRYIRNIFKLVSNINSNPIIEYKKAKLVLLEEQIPPHTFLNCIFLNKTDYQNRKINEELYTHELIHVKQKHTLDVLFIETMKTVFWFNPIFIFYKKAIQLNHEFLADEKVVEAYNDIPFYQSLLLAHANTQPTFALTSNLNYSITKKRFIMMTKTVSKTKVVLYKIALLPLFSGLIFFMSVETIAQEKSVPSSKNTTETEKSISQTDNSKDKKRDAYYAGVRIIGKNKQNNTSINKMYEELTLEEKRIYLNYLPEPLVKKHPSDKEYKDFKDSKKYAIWIDEKNVSNQVLENYSPKDFAYFNGSSVLKNARSKKFPQPFQYTLYTHNYFDKNLKNSHLKFSGKTFSITIGNENRKESQKTINTAETKNIVNENVNEATKEKEIYSVAETSENPTFPGGIEKFYQFIGTNFITPLEPNLKGKVYITFIIEKDGNLSDFKILRDIGHGTGEEAIRVLKLSPKWNPGKIDGNPVKVMYSLPITIQSAN